MTAGPLPDLAGQAEQLVQGMAERELHLAVAESLTGGLVLATLTAMPGATKALLGGVVAYDVAVKSDVLGVDDELLERCGAVDPQVALEMARGVRKLLGADVGVATTGEAGPESASGKPVGFFFTAVDAASLSRAVPHQASGSRDDICRAAVHAALELAWQALHAHDSAAR